MWNVVRAFEAGRAVGRCSITPCTPMDTCLLRAWRYPTDTPYPARRSTKESRVGEIGMVNEADTGIRGSRAVHMVAGQTIIAVANVIMARYR
jgi:hypothetical protein